MSFDNDDLIMAPSTPTHDRAVYLDVDEDPSPPSGPTFQRADAVMAEPRPAEIIEGIAHADCVTVFAGESGASKTFAVLGLGAHVSDGIPCYGRAVEYGTVAYVSYEGDSHAIRFRALRDAQGHRLANFYLLRADAPLSPIIDRDRQEFPSRGELTLIASLAGLRAKLESDGQPPVRLIVIDTVRQSLSGSEDSSENISSYLRAVRRILASVPGAALILVHHSGWQDGDTKRKRERGSSALRGNVDTTLFLEFVEMTEAGHARLKLTTLKSRDVGQALPLHLIRRRVELAESVGDDLRRGPVTSCVIELDHRNREDREAAERLAIEHVNRPLDLQLLKLIHDRPEASTSQERLRATLGLGKAAIVASVARLAQQGLITVPDRQRQPYAVTPDGLATLEREVTA